MSRDNRRDPAINNPADKSCGFVIARWADFRYNNNTPVV
jgi:hypothetical protein